MNGLSESWRALRYGRPVVVVSGVPRSGTSMAMKMLEAGGLELVIDHERAADEDNPKGYYEDERVKELEKSSDRSWIRQARGKGIKVISRLVRSLPLDSRYRVILMRRDLGEVLASQRKMLERRGEEDGAPDERMRELLEKDLWQASWWMKAHGGNFHWIDLHYHEVLADPERQAHRIAGLVGGLDVRRMAEMVDPELYRNRAGAGSAGR
jgi:hypothetical protein